MREGILRRIAQAACEEGEPLVIEIGPGFGALTAHLLRRARRVIGVELDARLAERVRTRFLGQPGFECVHQNVLDTDLRQWGPGVLAGNLPYYISSPILARVLRLGPTIRQAVFLVQREVAERVVASPGRRDYGYLSVMARLLSEPELLFSVPPAAFRPPPKVDSAVVLLRLRPPPANLDALLDFVGCCFQQKRKTLRNNLAPVFGREAVDALPEAGLRAEQLEPQVFADLLARLSGPATIRTAN